MSEEKKVDNKEREIYLKELVEKYSDRYLKDIASGLGLNPDDYPNKRAIAEAILKAREH